MSSLPGDEMMTQSPQEPHQQTTSQSGSEASQFEFNFHDTYHPVFNDIEASVLNHYWEYINGNPQVFEEFRKEAVRQIQQGRTHLRAKLIIENLRDNPNLKTEGQFKVNNSYASVLARHLIMLDKSFEDYFELRKTPGVIHEQEY